MAHLPSPDEAKKELETIYAEWVRLALEGRTNEMSQRFRDPEFVAFKPDGTAFSPDAQFALTASQKPKAARHFVSLEVKPEKVWIHPDGRIFEFGTNTSVTQNGNEPSKAATVRYLAIWHRQPDGSLKYRTDIVIDKQ